MISIPVVPSVLMDLEHYLPELRVFERERVWMRQHLASAASNTFPTDQEKLVGLLGEWACSLYLTGSERSFFEHREHVRDGDGGNDIAGGPFPIDVKSTLVKTPQGLARLGSFRLFVTEFMLRPPTRFVSALVPEGMRVVWLCGWATCDDLQDRGELRTSVRNVSSRSLAVEELRPMATLLPEWRQ